MNIDTRELDRLLCERAGIGPLFASACKCGHNHSHIPAGWVCGSRTGNGRCMCTAFELDKRYPAVSTDGNAMLLLIAALRESGRFVNRLEHASDDNREYWLVTIDGESADTMGPLPLAVALAAAAAWGIPVPQTKEQASEDFVRELRQNDWEGR